MEVTETFRGQLQGLTEEQQKLVGSLSSELEMAKSSLAKLQQVNVTPRLLITVLNNQL